MESICSDILLIIQQQLGLKYIKNFYYLAISSKAMMNNCQPILKMLSPIHQNYIRLLLYNDTVENRKMQPKYSSYYTTRPQIGLRFTFEWIGTDDRFEIKVYCTSFLSPDFLNSYHLLKTFVLSPLIYSNNTNSVIVPSGMTSDQIPHYIFELQTNINTILINFTHLNDITLTIVEPSTPPSIYEQTIQEMAIYQIPTLSYYTKSVYFKNGDEIITLDANANKILFHSESKDVYRILQDRWIMYWNRNGPIETHKIYDVFTKTTFLISNRHFLLSADFDGGVFFAGWPGMTPPLYLTNENRLIECNEFRNTLFNNPLTASLYHRSKLYVCLIKDGTQTLSIFKIEFKFENFK